MTKYIEFDEPWGEYPLEGRMHTIGATIRILEEDVIKSQRHREPRYTSDEDALDDFLVIHWARKVEVP